MFRRGVIFAAATATAATGTDDVSGASGVDADKLGRESDVDGEEEIAFAARVGGRDNVVTGSGAVSTDDCEHAAGVQLTYVCMR